MSAIECVPTQLGLLLVDDEEFNIKALKRILRGQGFILFSANSADEALAIMARENVAIIISDMRMPKVSGDALLIEIGERWPDTMKIVLSGYNDLSDTLRLLSHSSIFRYISKPWDDAFLLSSIHEAAAVYWGRVMDKIFEQSTQEQLADLRDSNLHLRYSAEQSQLQLKKINEKLKTAYEEEKVLREEREQAERENDAKSHFLATMSHEIRTPLNSIIATNSLLLESQLSDEQMELVKLGLNGANTLLALINDILDFSKINAGKLELHERWFSPIDLVEEVTELLAGNVVNSAVELISIIAPGTPEQVYGDPTRVRQIVTNLVSNGIKFTERGCVTIHLSYDNELRICVKDSGIGIAHDRLETIFQEFTQVDGSSTRAMGGTGLGLSISRELTQLMQGRISVKSELGAGSQFSVHLPLTARNPIALPKIRCANACLLFTNNTQFGESFCALMAGFSVPICIASDIKEETQRAASAVFYDVEALGIPDIGDFDQGALKIALIANDGVGRALHLKTLGFDAVLRKPPRLSSLVRYFVCNQRFSKDIDHFSIEQHALLEKWQHDNETARKQRSSTDIHARILLAEDSPSNQAIIKSILRNMKVDISVAENGQEVVEKAQQEPYDLILMDMFMPVIDGIAATQKIITGSGPNAKTPIVALTANAYSESQALCLASGMCDFITKPVDIHQFREKVRYWAKQNQASDSGQPAPVAAPEIAPELVSMAVIRQLEHDLSREALPNIIAIYLDETRHRVPKMLEYSQRQDWTALRAEAHTLKSSSGSFGALALQALASQIENSVDDEDWPALSAHMHRLSALSQQSLQQLYETTINRD